MAKPPSTSKNKGIRIPPKYGRVQTAQDIGALARAERKRQGVSLQIFYESSGITTRFMSEFERGKPSTSRILEALQMLGLEVMVVPRADADLLQHHLKSRLNDD